MRLALASLMYMSISTSTTIPTCMKPTIEKFDDVKATPILPTANKAPVVNGIDFSAFRILSPGPTLKPASSPNTIGVGAPTTLTNGEVTAYPRASIFAVDKVRAFDLTSIRYGCYIANGAFPRGVSTTPCTVSVSGYTFDGRQVSETTFSYAPMAVSGQPMGTKEFGNLKALKNVTFEIVAAGVLPAAVAVFSIDDVKVCRYY